MNKTYFLLQHKRMLVEPEMDKTDLGSLIYTYDLAAGEALGKRENHTPG